MKLFYFDVLERFSTKQGLQNQILCIINWRDKVSLHWCCHRRSCKPDRHFFKCLMSHTPWNLTRLALTKRNRETAFLKRDMESWIFFTKRWHHLTDFLSHKETGAGYMQREWGEWESGRETGTQISKKKKEEEAVFTNCCHLLSIPLINIVLICNPHCSPKHNFLFKTRG